MNNSNYSNLSYITDGLNPAQHQAVTAAPSNLLILAGAGSGKTRVLVHRIAWLIRTEHVSPHAILAVTFTNKAAKEMQQRIEKLLVIPIRNLWIGTFHGLAHRLLRMHWQLAGLPQSFQVIDSDDQLRMIKKIQKDLHIDDKDFSPKQTQYFINNKKDEGLRYKDLDKPTDRRQKYLQEIYKDYENQSQQLGLVDFAEIILRAKELFINNPELKFHYQQRFQHVLVDEFQDTNTLQYQWLKLFYHQNYFTMVGDDDQSIYGWRGARVENITNFSADYQNSKIIRLEQNYRSTATILNAANSLISNNSNRMGKNLWTSGPSGEPITVYQAFNDIDEAKYIIEQVKSHHNAGIALGEMAILYRANHQSRQFEEYLLRSAIPYKIYGGQRFFERAEIKDAMAYLRLTNNSFDNASFDRIINWPTRGIGKQSLDTISNYAKENNLTLWHASEQLVERDLLKNKARASVADFLKLIKNFRSLIDNFSLAQLVKLLITESGLRDYYFKEEKGNVKTRVENLDELITACSNFEQEFVRTELEQTPLQAFLSHAVLEAGEEHSKDNKNPLNSLNLMTIHTAKGLEFKIVYIVGLEEGLFPHEMCISDSKQLAEERRLCYVGITRAMSKLYLSFCEVRRIRGEDRYNLPSRFLKELPQDLLKQEKVSTYIGYNIDCNTASPKSYQSRTQPQSRSQSGVQSIDSEYNLGQTVRHGIFGTGVIISADGYGDKARVQVKFAQPHGIKWLIAKIAKLEIVS
ncbi:MAG: DNA helicase II [Gammaproteobacteria bacterium]|nr:DNA helicase II [Gammaproteobacteria bacterium]